MNLPPLLERNFRAAKTVEELKEVIADILDEYDFGILAEHEGRIDKLETEKKK